MHPFGYAADCTRARAEGDGTRLNRTSMYQHMHRLRSMVSTPRQERCNLREDCSQRPLAVRTNCGMPYNLTDLGKNAQDRQTLVLTIKQALQG